MVLSFLAIFKLDLKITRFKKIMGFLKQLLIKAGFEKARALKMLNSDKPGAYEVKPKFIYAEKRLTNSPDDLKYI